MVTQNVLNIFGLFWLPHKLEPCFHEKKNRDFHVNIVRNVLNSGFRKNAGMKLRKIQIVCNLKNYLADGVEIAGVPFVLTLYRTFKYKFQFKFLAKIQY